MDVAGFVAIFLCCICGVALMNEKSDKKDGNKKDENK